MSGNYDPLDIDAGPLRRSVLRRLIAPGLAFLLGLGAMGYLLAHWDAAARVIGVAPQPASRPQCHPDPCSGRAASGTMPAGS